MSDSDYLKSAVKQENQYHSWCENKNSELMQ